MTRSIKWLPWVLFALYVAAVLVAVGFAIPPLLGLVGFEPARTSFTPALITGLPWSLSTLTVRGDSVTTLALLLVSNLLNLAIASLLARGRD